MSLLFRAKFPEETWTKFYKGQDPEPDLDVFKNSDPVKIVQNTDFDNVIVVPKR
jgi:hypothetical protein